MTNLISKLQYKYYEKGEFTEQKARSLDETIELIKTYPWDKQRGQDIQITCPSVTILDENGNYLKMGVYFSGKYCFYYLDADHHLYEHPVATVDEALLIVNNFFAGTLDLEKFERNHTVFNVISHFETGSFY